MERVPARHPRPGPFGHHPLRRRPAGRSARGRRPHHVGPRALPRHQDGRLPSCPPRGRGPTRRRRGPLRLARDVEADPGAGRRRAPGPIRMRSRGAPRRARPVHRSRVLRGRAGGPGAVRGRGIPRRSLPAEPVRPPGNPTWTSAPRTSSDSGAPASVRRTSCPSTPAPNAGPSSCPTAATGRPKGGCTPSSA